MDGTESTTYEAEVSTVEEEKVNSPIEYKIAAVLLKYYAPIQIILALFGNVMILLIFSRKTMRGSVTSFLFRVLAVADISMILVTLIPEAMLELGGTSAAYSSDVRCKVHGYLYFAGRVFAVWVLVLIVLERFIGINFPHRASSLITFKRAKIALIVLFITIYLLYAMILHIMEAKTIYNDAGEVLNYYCALGYGNIPYFEKKVFGWYDLCLYSLIPFILMISANITIIYRLVQASRLRAQTTGDTSDVTGMTAMLLGISFGFIACTSPYCISYFERRAKGISSPGSYLFYAFSAVLVNMNHCINFYIYCLTGTRFRKELREMFGCAAPPKMSMTEGTNVNKNTVSAVA